MPPPVYFRGPEGANFWRAVELFFSHIERHQFEQYPLISELEGIRRGAQGSFQTACLTLAVGVESIAKVVLKDELVSPPSIQSLLDYIDSWQGDSTLRQRAKETLSQLPNADAAGVLDHLDAWKGDATLKKRAKAALSRLSEVSAADRMYAWAKRTGIREEIVNRWKKLRHPKAHGDMVTEEGSGWNLYCSTAELLHRMVAYAIGYGGPILETSRVGWGLETPGSDLSGGNQAQSGTERAEDSTACK